MQKQTKEYFEVIKYNDSQFATIWLPNLLIFDLTFKL